MTWSQRLPDIGESSWGDEILGAITEVRTRIEALEAAGQPLAGVNSITVDGETPLQGDVDISQVFAPLVHFHAGEDITSGTVPIARLGTNTPIVYVKSKGGFGAAAGSFPASRSAITSDASRAIVYIANSDPGATLMIDGVDVWIDIP